MGDSGASQPNLVLKIGLTVTARLLHRLGAGRYLISDALANAAFALLRERRRAAMDNYAMVFPNLTRRQLRRLAHRSFREYGRTSIDFVYFCRLRRSQIMRVFRGHGAEAVLRLRAEGKPGILVLMHLGAWDAGGAWASAMGLPLTAVMDDAGNSTLRELVLWARSEIGLRAVVASKAARPILQALRRGEWIALLADIPGPTPSVEVEFLGHAVDFSTAPALLAARTGAPMVAVVAVRSPAGGYMVEVHPPVRVPPEMEPEEALRPILKVFEDAVRRWPEQWYPFDRGRLRDLPQR